MKVPGVYGDGRGGSGLALRVHRTKRGDVSKSWRQRVRIGGRLTSVGLGTWPFVSLQAAREQAVVNRGNALSGIDPRGPVAPVAAPVVSGPTFDEAAESTIALHRPGWRGKTTEYNWRHALAGLAFGGKPVASVTSGEILEAVESDWLTKPNAARERLQKIGAVIKWSIGAGHRTDDPTVQVRAALPRQTKRTKHYKAVPVAEAPVAMRGLRECGKSRKLTRLLIAFQALTGVRPGEAKGATWSEIDGDLWTVPASRMKAKREHRVPLSSAALDVLRAAARETSKRAGLIFPSTTGKEIQASATKKCLQVCGIKATAHGWRSTFRDYCAETGVAREVAEACLAHVVGGVEGAYFRSDLLERRREVMERWGMHLTT